MKKKIANFVNEKFNLVFFVVLIFLLCLSCFVDWGVLALIVFIIIFSLFLNVTNVLATLLFLVSFLVCFSFESYYFWNYIYLYLVFVLFVKYIKFLLNSKEETSFKQYVLLILKKINWKLLVPILVLFVYWLLPMHSNSIGQVVGNILDFVVLYLAFEMRSQIKFPHLIQIFCFGIIISSFMSLMQPISNRLQQIMVEVPPVDNYTRFAGLTTHPNQFAIFAFIALSLLLFLKYHNKISHINFYLLFAGVFTFGYLATSKGFVIAFILTFVIFGLMLIIKNKKRSLKTLSILVCVIITIGAIFTTATEITFSRVNNLFENVASNDKSEQFIQKVESNIETYIDVKECPKFSKEWWDGVYNGEIKYDPGRVGIWKEYINDWSSSVSSILFGRGFSRAYIGTMAPHNLYLLVLWRDGIIGVAIQCCILLLFINFKKVKEIKKYLSTLIVLVPYSFSCFFELGFMFFYLLFMLCCVYCFNKDKQSDSVLVVTSGVLPVPAVSGGAVEVLTQSIINQNEVYKKEKFEVVSIYNDKAKEIGKTYKLTSFDFYKPNFVIIFIDKCIYYFAKNVLKKQKTMTFRNLVQRLCYIHYVSTKMRDDDYKSIIIENFSTSYLSLKLYENDLKYIGRYYYHLHNEVSSTFGCKKIIQKSKNILCVSNFIKASIAKTLALNIDSKNLSVLKNCIDTTKFNGKISDIERDELCAKFGIDKDKKVIIFTGRLTKEKGIDVLLEALKNVARDDYVLLVVGSYFFSTKTNSQFEERLNQLQKELAGKVIFTGFVNYEELPKLYALANFAVLPSMWDEPAGLTILEATSSNLPLITTNSGGIVEYCNLNNAIVLDRDQNIQKNLAKEISVMLNESNKVDNHDFVKNFNLSKYYENFIKLIN